jgi:hypothetical protein
VISSVLVSTQVAKPSGLVAKARALGPLLVLEWPAGQGDVDRSGQQGLDTAARPEARHHVDRHTRPLGRERVGDDADGGQRRAGAADPQQPRPLRQELARGQRRSRRKRQRAARAGEQGTPGETRSSRVAHAQEQSWLAGTPARPIEPLSHRIP